MTILSFGHLHELLYSPRDRGTNRYYSTVVGAINAIINRQILEAPPLLQMSMKWDAYNFHPETATWDEYLALWPQMGGPIEQSLLLQTLSEQTRFPRQAKLELYYTLLTASPSLEVCRRTCRIINAETNMGFNILGAPRYLEWVTSQLGDLTIANCTGALRTNAQDPILYFDRARAYIGRKDFDHALSDLKKAISLNPTNAQVLNSIAWYMATCPTNSMRDGKQAVDLALKACQATQWKTWNLVGTLAAAYAEAGDFDQAIKYQKQVMVMPDVPEGERANQKMRLSLFEQRKPTHEDPH